MRCKSSRITNRQVCANHNNVMQKGVLHGMFVFHQFLFIKQTYLNGLRGYLHRSCNLVHIVSFGIYCSVLEWGGGGGARRMGGLGRPYIKFKLCPFAIYSCVMEIGVFKLFFIIHQFRVNLQDMPHRIWRKISHIMKPSAYCQGFGLIDCLVV